MMKTALVLAGLLLSCSSQQDAAPSDLSAVKAHRDYLCATFDPQTVERCDRITFVALMSAACGKDYNLAAYEENGKWNRDSETCYPKDSKSECSLDGYLSVLHAKVGDLPALQRMQGYLSANDWICGEGPEGVTSIKSLKSVIDHMAGAGLVDEADASALGFRGHLLASYMWLRKRIGMTTIPGTFELLYKDTPPSPLYAALAGDEAGAVSRLMDFPAPYAQFWGSAPDAVIYAASVAALEGK